MQEYGRTCLSLKLSLSDHPGNQTTQSFVHGPGRSARLPYPVKEIDNQGITRVGNNVLHLDIDFHLFAPFQEVSCSP
jgi:hypothetical protein